MKCLSSELDSVLFNTISRISGNFMCLNELHSLSMGSTCLKEMCGAGRAPSLSPTRLRSICSNIKDPRRGSRHDPLILVQLEKRNFLTVYALHQRIVALRITESAGEIFKCFPRFFLKKKRELVGFRKRRQKPFTLSYSIVANKSQ